MSALLSFIFSGTSFASSLWAGVAAAAEPFNWSPQVDDPIHTPAELVESMHSAFGYNHCRAVHAKGIIFEGEFVPDSHARGITQAPHLQGRSSKVTVHEKQSRLKLTKSSHDKRHQKPCLTILAPFAWVGIQESFVRRTGDFHQQMKEPDLRDHHLLLDEQDKQILAIADDVGARVQDWRNALPSISDMSHHYRSRTRIRNPLRRMKMKA